MKIRSRSLKLILLYPIKLARIYLNDEEIGVTLKVRIKSQNLIITPDPHKLV